jgi:hypothetical protein
MGKKTFLEIKTMQHSSTCFWILQKTLVMFFLIKIFLMFKEHNLDNLKSTPSKYQMCHKLSA